MNKLEPKTIIIAGGGTGGHIYPAIAIGRALVKMDSSIAIRFVGTKAGLESKIMERENLDLDLIKSGKLNFSGHPIEKIKTLLKIPMGLVQSFFLILKYKPDFILGVGGYASAPFLLMAALMKKKTALWEPNAHPGMANRWLSKLINTSYLVFANSAKNLFSINNKVFGMPLREEIEKAQSQELVKPSDCMHILCFGGSQGSQFLNDKISDFILNNTELHSKIKLVHQTGVLDFQKMKTKYKNINCVEVHEFIYDMPKYYATSHIQFCRGGASTIAEASAFGVIPLIVPIPAADDHQLRNAEVVVNASAGFLFKQNEFDNQKFLETINLLLQNVDLRNKMSVSLRQLAPKNAATAIANDIISQL